MEKNNKIKKFPPFILNAPKVKFKKPTLKPTPLILTESSYSMEYSDSDTDTEFSSDENITKVNPKKKNKVNYFE